jgi:cardiolipin synthase A/B
VEQVRILLWLAALIIIGLMIYTLLVTPGRFRQCLDAPMRFYLRDPNEGFGAQLPDPIAGNTARLLVNGNEILPAMIEAIDQAEKSVRWHVMLFLPDEAGEQLADALGNAARRGLDVQLAFDIRQSMNGNIIAPYPAEKKTRFNQSMIVMLEGMRASGVVVRESLHLQKPAEDHLSKSAREIHADYLSSTCLAFNHIDHRKILLIDGSLAIVGGMNVGNEYLYLLPPDLSRDAVEESREREESGEPEAWEKWQDSAVLVEGPAVAAIARDFDLRWELLGGTPIVGVEPVSAASEGIEMRVLNQRPGLQEISSSMIEMIDLAQNDIFLAYPYVSHHALIDHLKAASKRGVQVTFVFPGDKNDVSFSRRYLRLFSRDLLDAGIQLYENNSRMNHTKIMVVDGKWVSIGSHNFNYRSVNHDQELNLEISDVGFAAQVIERIFMPYLEQAHLLEDPYRYRWNLIDLLVLPFS